MYAGSGDARVNELVRVQQIKRVRLALFYAGLLFCLVKLMDEGSGDSMIKNCVRA